MIQRLYNNVQSLLSRQEWLVFFLGLAYALFWQSVTPIQYTGDSDSYYGLARMLVGKDTVGIPLIFRPIGYPLMQVLTGMPLGTFKIILLVQALFAAIIPVFIYRIIAPDSTKMALAAALITIASGVTTVHSPQIMTEQLFMFLLFLGLAITVSLVRYPERSPGKIYWMTIVFACLNTVRPIAGPMFWLIILILSGLWWYKNLWTLYWKKAARASILFVALMMLWVVVDDSVFSNGARYSPSVATKVGADTRLETYLYDLPFHEAYFEPWTRRALNPQIDPATFTSLRDRPGMAAVRDIVRVYLHKHVAELKEDTPPHPKRLFGQYLKDPDALVDRMFAEPNYIYSNYIRTALETDAPLQRKQLFLAAAKDAHRNWPMRWLDIFYKSPISIVFGPSRGNGAIKYALAFGPLRGCECSDEFKVKDRLPSMVNPSNGPATQLLFKTLTDILYNNPEFWHSMTDPSFAPYIGKPEALITEMLERPTYNYAWFTTVMLWQTMGYDAASQLMGRAADESFARNSEAFILRVWDTALMVAEGPGIVQFDTTMPSFARIDSYPYMETPQLNQRHIRELQATKIRFDEPYLSWQKPTKALFLWFYFTKPIFFLTSFVALAILWARRRPLIVPLLLMIPYGSCIVIYGALFTALPRYTDPTILLPMMVTFLAVPTCVDIVRERRQLLKDKLLVS